MLNPRLMVLDEPTSNLDARAMCDLHDMIAELKHDGVTVVIAEHRLAWCTDLADRFVLFDHGTIIGDYTAAEFCAKPQQWLESQGLRALDMAPYREIVRSKTVGAAMQHRIGADAPAAPSSPVIIETRGLAIGYRRRFQFGRRADRAAASTGTAAANVTAPANGADRAGAVDARIGGGSNPGKTGTFRRDIADFALYGGEIVGLMGHNGAGKSTLVRTLCGLAKPLAGRVLLHGRPARAAALTRAGFLVMQDVNYQLFADSTREELLLGAGDGDDGGSRSARKSPATLGKLADEVLAALDLLPFAERHPMSLSGGQKQRLAIGSALMCGKELIVLDEPTSGLDRLHMMQVGALLRRLADGGHAVLVVTHDEELAALWCDRIINLDAEADAALGTALDACAEADT
ncbi:ATP-binding cassette domain-containing protein [Bifidobacterium jacchi]|uniref:ATP-binding cassette domain-containing protein n=2 Tax=Bifidobacterium jacchi TaxID=2490545 RepID=A0A5N5RKZ5_9BIFI|nr:ATP-binding cassette domain-containing protein [Bifidobacterium jacchi]